MPFSLVALPVCWYKPVAGASPLFPPRYHDEPSAQQALLETVRRSPRACGCDQTRWSLAALRQALPWLGLKTDAGLQRLLKRLQIHWLRARSYIHSPDPDYAAKLATVQAVRMCARLAEREVVTLYLDECSIERQPTLAQAYEQAGRQGRQPLARRATSSDTITRLIATLDHLTGKVVFRRASAIRLATLVTFYQDVRAAYPHAERIYIVQDNWPVHYHPDVLVALEPQETRFARILPASWSTKPSAAAQRKWAALKLPIQIVPLPTYASWTNPIEKLWRGTRQNLTHLHPWAWDLARLRQAIDDYLTQFAHGSQALLRYVGLCPG